MQDLFLYFMGVVGLVGAVLGLFGVLFGRATEPRLAKAIRGVVGLALGACAVAAAWTGRPMLLWLPAALLAVVVTPGLLAAGVLVGHGLAFLHGRVRQPRLGWALLLAGAPAVCLWGIYQFDESEGKGLNDLMPELELIAPSNLQEVSASQAVTDDGRPVRLFAVPHKTETSPLLQAEANFLARGDFMVRLIRTAPLDLTCNCHGWVFAGGAFWIRGQEVERILADNGYHTVDGPQPNDLVVYRASAGQVAHTALVRLVADGLVMVESKWGPLSRYLHQPQDQTYGPDWTYYRSTRKGHLLRGLGGAPAPPLQDVAFRGAAAVKH